MVDFTRAHERLVKKTIEGEQFSLAWSPGLSRERPGEAGTPSKAAEVLITPHAMSAGHADLLIHFHGAAWLPFQAALSTDRPLVVAVLNLGQGGGIYDRTFSDPAAFDSLVDQIRMHIKINRVYLSGFSAGYGAVRAILRNEESPSPGPLAFARGHPLPASRGEGSRASSGSQPEGSRASGPVPLAGEDAAERRVRVDGILLLDGLHTSYVGNRQVDPIAMQPFLDFAREAVAGPKRFVFSHSEIFPGTFASTTETADYLIHELGLKQTPVVRWGPRGMQQLSEVRSGNLLILGFAGNSAPDHVDQFHAMPELLQLLFEGGPK